jgi:hypothetical protein
MEELSPLHKKMQFKDTLYVKDLCKENFPQHPRHIWKTQPHELNILEDNNKQPWGDLALQRKIHINEKPNILRWGHSPIGKFSVKESYNLQENYHMQPKENIWDKI